jgi:hypothetical protein
MLNATGALTKKALGMTDRRDLVEAFCAALLDAFGSRAVALAESQRDGASGVVHESWQQIVDALISPGCAKP